jgi:hypothetical protein
VGSRMKYMRSRPRGPHLRLTTCWRRCRCHAQQRPAADLRRGPAADQRWARRQGCPASGPARCCHCRPARSLASARPLRWHHSESLPAGEHDPSAYTSTKLSSFQCPAQQGISVKNVMPCTAASTACVTYTSAMFLPARIISELCLQSGRLEEPGLGKEQGCMLAHLAGEGCCAGACAPSPGTPCGWCPEQRQRAVLSARTARSTPHHSPGSTPTLATTEMPRIADIALVLSKTEESQMNERVSLPNKWRCQL